MFKVYSGNGTSLEALENISPNMSAALYRTINSEIKNKSIDSSISDSQEGYKLLREIAKKQEYKIAWDRLILREIDMLRMAEKPDALSYKSLPDFLESLKSSRELIHKLYVRSNSEIPSLSRLLDDSYVHIQGLSDKIKDISESCGILPDHSLTTSDHRSLIPCIISIKKDLLAYLNSCLPNPPKSPEAESFIESDAQRRTHAA